MSASCHARNIRRNTDSSTINPSPRKLGRSTLAVAVSGVLFAPVVYGQSTQNAELETLNVQEEVTPDTNPYAVPGAPYLSKFSADPRRTRPLAETPQTITVLTSTQIEETGRTDLKEILDGQPGITLGTGENGNAFGDRYIIRGHEARSDMFVDGLRDPGMTIRESFAVEQVEITKGPSSTFAGRGSTGGAVNSVTKRASTEYDFNKVSAGAGTDNYYRATLDTNHAFNYDTAIRANLLLSGEDVPKREPADRERKGAALSLAHQATDDLDITMDYYHFEGDDMPDLGTYIPNLGNGEYGEPYADIPAYLQNQDFLESSVDTGTVRLGYEVNPDTRLINLTRYGTTDNGYVLTGARGTTGYSNMADAEAGFNGFSTETLSTHQGWQEVDYFGNQLSLLTDQEIGGRNHELVFSAVYTDQSVLNGVYEVDNNGAANCFASGRGGVSPSYCVRGQDGEVVENLNGVLGRDIQRGEFDSDWNVKTISLSVMDNVDLTEKWTLFTGLRYDEFDYSNLVYFSAEGGERQLTEFADKDGFWNGHLGLSYEFIPGANLYGSYSTSTNINGGESDLGANCGYGGICADGSDPRLTADPESTESIELGTKWLVSEKLLATAAAFKTTKSDVMESPSGDSYSALGSLNTGENEVEGLEFGLTGNLTSRLSAQIGITVMNAKVTKSVDPANEGKTLGNFADQSASLHLRYQATPRFAFGGTVSYESERFAGQPDSAANEGLAVPEYTVFDAFASYNFNRDLSLRLNVNNVFDEDYYLAAYRSGAFTYIGDRRNARLTLKYDF